MITATAAVGLFAGAWLLHLAIWRLRLPQHQTQALLAIFLGTWVAATIAAAAALAGGVLPLTVWQLVQVGIFHVPMSLAYIAFYSALAQDSPTLSLLTFIAGAGSRGRSLSEIREVGRYGDLVHGRLNALVHDGLAARKGGAYRSTPRGRSWARVFDLAARLLGLEQGG